MVDEQRGVHQHLCRGVDVLMTMRLLRAAPLAFPLLLVAATCVTNVTRQGARGPWAGDIINTGDEPIYDVRVPVEIVDSRGAVAARRERTPCPSALLPGDRAAFEEPALTAGEAPASAPPFTARFPVGSTRDGFGASSGDGLLAEITSRFDQGRALNVRVTNNSGRTYADAGVCGVALAAGGGAVASVAFGAGDRRLTAGESTTLTLFFAAAPPGEIRLYPSAVFAGEAPACCPRQGASPWRSVDTGPFSVLLPPGWSYEPRQGIDSFVGAFSGEGVTLSFDYGWYSGDPEDPSDATQRVHRESIAGRAAKIVLAGGYAALHLQVSPSPPDEPLAGFTPVDLFTVYGEDLAASEREVVLQIFRSLRFDTR
jgi:hypothetical protein